MITFICENWCGLLLSALVGYLLGSVSFAIIVTRLTSHKDIRDSGSGNAGATNVLRSQGKLPALLTAVGDLGKSVLAVFLGGLLLISLTQGNMNESNLRVIGQYFAGLFCIAGHLYPVYFGFRGGKGVITTLGIMLILRWPVALAALAVFAVVFLCSRMVSLGSCLAGLSLIPFTYLDRAFLLHASGDMVWFCTAMSTVIAGIIIVKHIPNIRRIINGTENKL